MIALARRALFIPLFVGAALSATTSSALEAAQGEIILTVTGAISNTNADGAAEFDLAMIEAFDTVTIRTTTIWTDGVQTFDGVELDDLLDLVGASGATLRAAAVNDYAVDIPSSDAVDGGPIIAFQRNGSPMSLRDKGPLWIIYPYDSKPEYQSELIYSRSIWQFDRLEVLP